MMAILTLGVYPSKRGGAEIHSFQHARILVSKGIQTVVITERYSKRGWAVEYGEAGMLLTPFIFILKSFLALARISHSLDLVHVHFATYFPIPAYLMHRWKGIPYIVSCHGSDILRYGKQRFWRRIQRVVLGDAAFVTTTSSELGRVLESEFGIPPGRVRVVANGIDPIEIASARIGVRADSEIAFVANLRPEKDPLNALNAFLLATERDPRLHMTMVGDGILKEAVTKFIGVHELEGRVQLTGSLPHAEALMVVARSSLFVLSSVTEGGNPLALMEAMALGTPVVACRVGGVKDVLTDGVNGILVPPRDPEAIARAIVLLTADQNFRNSIGARAAASARDRTWEKTVGEYLRIYAESRGSVLT